jgi:hypothetical protein
VTDVLALDNVDYVLGDVGSVVADTFEIFGDEDEFKCRENHTGIAHHVSQEFAENLIAVLIDLIVASHDFLSELDVTTNHRIQRIPDLLLDYFGHAGQIDVGLDAGMTKDAQRTLGDVDGLIADAFKVIVDAGNGEDEAQVGGHELVESEELNNSVVDFELKFVDRVFFIKDTLGELFIGIEDGVNRLMNGALGEAAHPKEAFLELVQILFEVAFHNSLSLCVEVVAATRNQSNNESHPNLPVIYASVRGSPGVVKRCGVVLNSIIWPVRMKAVKSLMRAACCIL